MLHEKICIILVMSSLRVLFPNLIAARAAGTAAIAKVLTGARHKLPVVGGCIESKLKHPVRKDIARLAVDFDNADLIEAGAAGSGDKLTHASGIGSAARILRPEALIDMVVARNEYTCAVLIENFEEGLHMWVIAVDFARAEIGVVPVRKNTASRIGVQILSQPFFLCRAPMCGLYVAVERDDVPCADIVAVIT